MATPPQSSRFERQITNLIRASIDPALIETSRLPGLGNPDLASTYGKVAVFVDGCYWHGCPEHAKDDRRAAERRARDERVNAKLDGAGWIRLRLWEHEEHLAPFLAQAANVITSRADERRADVLAHIAGHDPGNWCSRCDMWPHVAVPDGSGRCSRCTAPLNDHEASDYAWKLFGPDNRDPDAYPKLSVERVNF